MTRAIRIHETGGPEVMRVEDVETGAPAAGQVLVAQRAIGVNFIDVYHRTGLYPVALPAVIGQEAAGVVEAVGPDVADLRVGDRVAYVGALGAYAERRVVAADRVVPVPSAIGDDVAAAAMLKGMTARYLLKDTTRVGPDDTIVVHAAAGGTGQLLVQWAKHLGARVLGVVSSDAKAEIVRALGADDVVVTLRDDLVERAKRLTDGRGVSVVYDSVGRDTFGRSIACLRPRGMLVVFGQSSGPVPPIDLGVLARASLYLTRPTLFTYVAARADLLASAADVFDAIAGGILSVSVSNRLPLERAADAHRALESRATTGATILLPHGA
ncbi:MAG: quinone oxidoreductase [Deltaproteobacteria bacterium]|nr:quinone oxidoreductase [Deltaproteobacteria bacterium]